MVNAGRFPGLSAAEILATLGLISARAGEANLARARLTECLSILHGKRSERAAAVALIAAAELAACLDQHESAAELVGASLRISRGANPSATPPEAVDEMLARLQARLGRDRFESALHASDSTPHPFEFYVSAALHWLDSIEENGSSALEARSGGIATIPSFASSTAVLVSRAKAGDISARERLASRYWEALRRFAHGRLPRRARDLMDTNDLVQVSMVRGMRRLGDVEVKRKGDFFAYLRRIVLNLVRDEIRRSSRKRRLADAAGLVPSESASPMDDLLENEAIEIFRAGVAKLTQVQREALTLRLEEGLPYDAIAAAIRCPSANAARMVVTRALTDLTRSIREA